MTATREQVLAGQAAYTPFTLKAYDFWVLGVSNHLAWNCPTARLQQHYDAHVSADHLEAGVGSGYFPDRARFPVAKPRIALMDLNPHTLDFAAARIARYAPEVYRRNLLEPIAFEGARFDSVGLNYLLHCVPGTMAEKAVVFDHLKALMKPGAVLFGSTALQGGVPRSLAARGLMALYNRQRIFSNRDDDLAGLTGELERRFRDVTVEVAGCVALFAGRA